MKITKKQLNKIIKEELSEMFAADNREQQDPIDTEYVHLIRKLGARTVILAIIDNLNVDSDAHRLVIDSLKSSMPEMAESQNVLKENSEYNVGDLVEIQISDDGYETSVERLDSDAEFDPTHGYSTSEKFLAKIIRISQIDYED